MMIMSDVVSSQFQRLALLALVEVPGAGKWTRLWGGVGLWGPVAGWVNQGQNQRAPIGRNDFIPPCADSA